MRIKDLLAKSDGTTLRKHTDDVVKAARQLHALLQGAPDMTRAAFYHDLGKSAAFFQMKMHGGKPENWYRHELLSLLVALSLPSEPPLSELELAAIATHHKNLNKQEKDGSPGLLTWTESGAAKELRKLCQRELPRHWEKAEKIYSKLPTQLDASGTVRFLKHIFSVTEMNTVWSEIGHSLAMHRAALIAADHLASSGVGTTIGGANIAASTLENYARSKIENWKKWNSIQEGAMCIEGNAMLVAPTGSGKTEAALLWALTNRRRYERIFYVLPYQVSINAMAERIAQAFPDGQGHIRIHDNENVSILHSNMDLAYLQDALNDQLPPDKAYSVALANRDAARKIYSPIKITTVYQLLDIFFGRKFFEVGLLELTDSLVIFDEIHAYDGHTIGLILMLLKCLSRLNARIFIMTATLPTQLKEMLKDAAGISDDHEIRLSDSDPLLSEVRRQIVLQDCRIEDMVETIRQTVREGKQRGNRTVCVCNTVRKAIDMWNILQEFQPLLVHSRFTLGDRAVRETKKNIQKYDVVISTQVIEVSLDVSFDVMFTELAPVDSLLQRFGRVNRHGKPDPNNPSLCYVACGDDEGSQRIYDPDLLERTCQNAPNAPLTFNEACNWIERVYPNGLTGKEKVRMNTAHQQFAEVVENLKPMLDPPANVDIETNLFRSIAVIPAEYEKVWRDYKEEGKNLKAKGFIVNVSIESWRGAESKCEKEGRSASRTYEVKGQRYTIALFKYDENRGLLLDEPLPPGADASHFIF